MSLCEGVPVSFPAQGRAKERLTTLVEDSDVKVNQEEQSGGKGILERREFGEEN